MRKQFFDQLITIMSQVDNKTASEYLKYNLVVALEEEIKRGFVYGDVAANGDIILAVVDAERFPLLTKQEDIVAVANSVSESNDLQDEISRIVEIHSLYQLEDPKKWEQTPPPSDQYEVVKSEPPQVYKDNADLYEEVICANCGMPEDYCACIGLPND